MIDQINLLPVELREAKVVRKRLTMILLGTLVGVLTLVMWWGYLVIRINYMQEELVKLRDQKNVMEQKIAVLKVYEERKILLDERQKKIVQLKEGEIDWSGILSDLGGVAPTNVWLTKIASAGQNVQIEGISVTYQDLASFMIRLQNVEFLTNATLHSYESAPEDIGIDALHFTILAKAQAEKKG